MLKRLLIGLIVLTSFQGSSQDIHYSQFYMNPVFINPGLTGNFDGQMRFSVNQRSQWRSVSRPYNTIAASAESKMGWVLPSMYHGFAIFHDVAGDGNLRTTEIALSTSYELYLNTDSSMSVTPGIYLAFYHRNIDFSKLTTDSQFNGYNYDPSLPQNEVFGQSSRFGFNAGVGATYKYVIEDRKKIVAGFGLYNIPQMKIGFYADDGIRRDMRFLFHARATYPINEKIDLMPAGFMQFQGKFKEMVIGSNVRYRWKDRRSEWIAPYAGLYFRGWDAVFLTGGLYYNNWIAGISYDFNISDLVAASKVRGGLEFSIQYILHIFKPKVLQYRVCPDYL